MPSVLITGANRGIGLEFARQYRSAGWDVIAAVRHSSDELATLDVRTETLDMSDLDDVAGFGGRIEGTLDLLIANAGIYGPARTAGADDARAWSDLLIVNTIAPTILAQAMLPAMASARGKMVAVSSRMGSIADSGSGSIPYRTSKAALNMAWHVLAAEAKPQGVAMATLNPGWVKTDMGGAGATITAEESVTAMRRVIDSLDISQSGSFIDRSGEVIPW